MGGGGGSSSSFSGYKPEEYLDKYRSLRSEEKVLSYEADVKNTIDTSLAQYNNRDVAATNTHLNTIKGALNNDPEYGGTIGVALGGSVSRKTFIDGLSDVDSLIILNKSELIDRTPKDVLDYFITVLRNRLPNTEIIPADRSITVRYSDVDIQLLPAIKSSGGIKIADVGGNNWSNIINPNIFARKLTTTNQKLNGTVIPTIKVVKSIISKLPEKKQLIGYHVEALAIEVFKGYTGEKKIKDMVKYFFQKAQEHVNKPIKDSTGQSIHVDDYLGAANSTQRQLVSDTLNRLSRDIKLADDTLQTNLWNDLLAL